MTKRYRSGFIDNARWDDIPLRDGDIIVTTPLKSGTTWTQMICALLVFQTPELPRPLSEISIWPDFLVRPSRQVRAILAAQQHRRIIKTHTPMDGLPYDERVTYLSIGRDPRDAGISADNNASNMNLGVLTEALKATMAADGVEPPPFPELPPPSESIHDRFRAWVDNPEYMFGLASYLNHFDTVWQLRERPNVLLIHYQDLQDDLAGSMRELAARLHIEVPEEKWPDLVGAATFASMKQHEDEVIPNRDTWIDKSRFLHRGTSGQWRSVLNDEDVAYYRERVTAHADPDMLGWLQPDRN
ncbi:sulfotransferase domain-containing protein [Actinoplanes sp. TBRC 11911]|uniref:sulfotransferase domain-containing protein n=1 Tax=Actinoplanes sp. TBRC 11911 TaxID=2729386 RepID=UPI00145CC180|nr:sulfotransferase domain-containing protein [Actinoplanes sp. TBRC 11911]NMO53393.1 sulfotransferase domain-containing protein [Actinoplanes sp. TBRC 11911]